MTNTLPGMLRNAAAILLCATGTAAYAQQCSATASSIDFGNVSPIRLNAVDATGTIQVTCTWPRSTANRNARVCLHLGRGANASTSDPRQLGNGANRLNFNLYLDAARSRPWGSILTPGTNTPMALLLSKPLLGTTASATVTYYGRIFANQPGASLVSGRAADYTESFTGANAAYGFRFFNTVDPPCSQTLDTGGTFQLSARTRVVNDCTIAATDMNFPATGRLDRRLDASASLNVRCTNGNAWRISLGGGNSGNVLQRRMQRQGTTDSVNYQLYTAAGRTAIWGDGTSSTAVVTGVATGQVQSVSIFGSVFPQATPRPGTYRDTIIATISF